MSSEDRRRDGARQGEHRGCSNGGTFGERRGDAYNRGEGRHNGGAYRRADGEHRGGAFGRADGEVKGGSFNRGGRGPAREGTPRREGDRPAGRTALPGSGGVRPRTDRAPRREVPGGRPNGSGRKPAGPSARDAALRALQDVVRGDAYASQALDRRLEEARLREDDRRLAAGMFYAAVENRLYIEYQLDRFLDQRPEPVVNDILHIAAAQLLFMDRVPDHAAVDEAVKQVRAARREGFTGLVNGVLRNLIRARDADGLALPDPGEDPVGWLSVRHSLARPAAQRLIAAYGLEQAGAIAAWTPVRRCETVRPNRLRMDGAQFEAWLDGQKLSWRRGAVEDAYIIEDGGNLAATEGYRKGLFSIQGESAMLAALAVEPRPGMQILDACAAPGGKTCLMAERMGTSGRVYAWDVHPHRVELIRAAARRLGLENVRPVERDARKSADGLALSMDAVLVDAPCSGLGVIADKPDIKYRQTEESLAALPQVQREILDACAGAVKPGGLLVYATCTILPEENEGQVRTFLARHPEFEPDDGCGWLPEALRANWSEGRVQILPNRDGLEGFFIARMRRKGV